MGARASAHPSGPPTCRDLGDDYFARRQTPDARRQTGDAYKRRLAAQHDELAVARSYLSGTSMAGLANPRDTGTSQLAELTTI